MKKIIFPIFFLLFLVLVIKFAGGDVTRAQSPVDPSTALNYEVQEEPLVLKPSRIGVNLGQWSSWGAQQYMTNGLMNPGFEGVIDRKIVIVSEADGESFCDEAGFGESNDHWIEAEFVVRTGDSAGKKGKIIQSLISGQNGYPQYFTDSAAPPLGPGDVITLTKQTSSNSFTPWVINDPSLFTTDLTNIPPNSPGKRSIKLTAKRGTSAKIGYELDAITERAGKLLPVEGKWSFSFWGKAEKPETPVNVLFHRISNGEPFFEKTFTLSTEWEQYEIDFIGRDRGPASPLWLVLESSKPDQSVWIDDLSLGPKTKSTDPFRREVIEALKELKPSFLRELPHLGDTMENRIAPLGARKPWVLRISGGHASSVFSYSLLEFLDLCARVDANPWIIIPPVFSDKEYQQLGEFLSKEATKERFSEVILEFGHENWNWMHRPQGIPYPKELGTVASRAWNLIMKSAKGKANLRYFLSGQLGDIKSSFQYLEKSPSVEGIAIAPYFFHSLDKGTPDDDALQQLFQGNFRRVQNLADELFAKDRSLAVYEVNLQATRGDAKAYERDRIVTGLVSGSALAKRIMDSLYVGADPIMVFNFSQFDTPTWEIADYVKLWGITRDLGPPVTWRPTGLAVKMLNRAIIGDLHVVDLMEEERDEADKLTLGAFHGEKSWSAVVISSSSTSKAITLKFPEDTGELPKEGIYLDAKSPFDTNEGEENVRIKTFSLMSEGRSVYLTVPPWGFVILLP